MNQTSLDTELDIGLKTQPKILYSNCLSGETCLNISFLDYSNMPTGTHKWYKAERIVEEAKSKRYDAILFINPVVDDREEANGSGIDALELTCALYYPEAQVVSVVHDSRALWRESIHPDFPNSRQRISLGLNLNKFYDAKTLETCFRNLMQDTLIDKDSKDARDFLYSNINNPMRCVDGTNLGDVGEYGLSEDLIEKMNEADYIVGSAGAGGRALNQINSVKNGKTKHIITIPNGHPLDPFHVYEVSASPRIQTKFRGKIHEMLKDSAVNRMDVIFKSISNLFGGDKAKELFVDRAIRQDNLNMKTSPDGAIGCAILRFEAFTEKGLKIFNSHYSTNTGLNYIYENLIPFGSNLLFVHTGISNNLKLIELIKQGVVR